MGKRNENNQYRRKTYYADAYLRPEIVYKPRPATEKQRKYLISLGYPEKYLYGLTIKTAATEITKRLVDRRLGS